MTNEEKHGKWINHCAQPTSRHSYCYDLIKPYYLGDPNAPCAKLDENGFLEFRSCEDCKRGFYRWLKEEYDPKEDPHWAEKRSTQIFRT